MGAPGRFLLWFQGPLWDDGYLQGLRYPSGQAPLGRCRADDGSTAYQRNDAARARVRKRPCVWRVSPHRPAGWQLLGHPRRLARGVAWTLQDGPTRRVRKVVSLEASAK